MSFDGICVAALVRSFSAVLKDARIAKIAQTGKDEVVFTLHTAAENAEGRKRRLLLSANASLPLALFTESQPPSPQEAPAFCMLLRKHLENGRIVAVTQPFMERVIRFTVSHRNELGDPCTRVLVVELMGKHSNIILTDENDTVIDAIRHVPETMSSVREVLPGRHYFLPDPQHKVSPEEIADGAALKAVLSEAKKNADTGEALVARIKGVSGLFARELLHRARLAGGFPQELREEEADALYGALSEAMAQLREGVFSPAIYTEGSRVIDFAAFDCTHLAPPRFTKQPFDDISVLLSSFYRTKQAQARIHNQTSELKARVQTLYERAVRKYDLQLQQLKDTEKKDRYRRRGELLTAYAHTVYAGAKEAILADYESGEEVRIALDETLSATENAQKYFARYQRMKRTQEALTVQSRETKAQIDELQSLRMAIALATDENDLAEIKRELRETGFLKGGAEKKGNRKKNAPQKQGAKEGRPLAFLTSEGFRVFVGKNNVQNDRLTFGTHGRERENDWWFHAKQIPGSHVVLRAGQRAVTDRAIEEAASLAAYFSAARDAGKAEVDYTQLKNVKKPGGAKPGFVVYYTNYSMVADADISALTAAEE